MAMKKYMLLLSVHFGLLWSSQVFAQNLNEPLENKLNEIAAIYSKNLKPYLLHFAELQTPPNLDSCERPRYRQAIVKIYETKEEFMLKELFSAFLKKPERKLESYMSAFSTTYQVEFPGLDYAYFKKCETEAALLIEKKN